MDTVLDADPFLTNGYVAAILDGSALVKSDSDWIAMESGKRFTYGNLDEPVDVRDIAHSLTYNSRFAGALSHQWSLGRHSLLVAFIAEVKNADRKTVLHALAHDFHEAPIGDFPTPFANYLTSVLGFDVLEAVKAHLDHKLSLALGIDFKHGKGIVKQADKIAFALEAAIFFSNRNDDLDRLCNSILEEHLNEAELNGVIGYMYILDNYSNEDVKDIIVSRFYELSDEVKSAVAA